MKIQDKLLIILCFTLVLILGAITLGQRQGNIAFGSADPNIFSTVNTSTSVVVGPSSTQLVATTSGRQLLIITNGSAIGAYVSLYFGATTTKGIYVPANTGQIFMDSNSTFTGTVYAISASSTASSTLSVTEK